jgi:hypothetical protein
MLNISPLISDAYRQMEETKVNQKSLFTVKVTPYMDADDEEDFD